ncbi:MAG: hypothetical protein RMJ28_06430 [Nitrososphaerota archaeon]|nr:hypothetical protein [Candidatus Calditenuaceae archaeon]MDW8073851.1 hypothetical protein [Nitrososphaerota archaeon]
MELLRAFDCLEYIGSEPKIPALSVSIIEPIGGYSESLTIPADTGFAGYILVDRGIYDKLGTAELPREHLACIEL